MNFSSLFTKEFYGIFDGKKVFDQRENLLMMIFFKMSNTEGCIKSTC